MTGIQAVDIVFAAFGVLAISVLAVVVISGVVDRQFTARMRPRFEPSPVDRPVDEPTVDLPVVACPGCGRNAGHNEGCRGISERAKQIQVPREGETHP